MVDKLTFPWKEAVAATDPRTCECGLLLAYHTDLGEARCAANRYYAMVRRLVDNFDGYHAEDCECHGYADEDVVAESSNGDCECGDVGVRQAARAMLRVSAEKDEKR